MRGVNLGRSSTVKGGYHIWIPELNKTVVTSEVYFQEGWMPWRAKGDQDRGHGVPTTPIDAEAQPPGVPATVESGSAPAAPPTEARAEDQLATAAARAMRGDSKGVAGASRKVLLLFSGP